MLDCSVIDMLNVGI